MKRSSLGFGFAAIASLGILASGCSGGGSSGGGGATTTTTVAGSVIANVVSNATVRVFSIDGNGALSEVGQGTSDGSGQFSFDATGAPPFLILASEGEYVDEATGTRLRLGSAAPTSLGSARPGTLECVVGQGSGTINVVLTPVSSLASRRLLDQLSTNPVALTSANVELVNRAVALALGLGNVDPRTVTPLDFTNASDAAAIAGNPNGSRARMGLLLAAFSQAGQTRNLTDPLTLVEGLALDFRDGTFDGLASGQTVLVGNANLGTAASAGLRTGAENFLTTARNLSGTNAGNHSTLLDGLNAPGGAGAAILGLIVPAAGTAPIQFFVNNDPATGTLRAHTAAEQTLADEVLRLTNVFRADNSLPPLARDPLAFQTAKAHAEDMAQRNYFDHNTSDFNGAGSGFSPSVRVSAMGLTGFAGENIAAGNSTANATVEQWKNSPPHRAAMLSTTHTHLGVGYANSGGSQFGSYWVQNFVRK